MPLLVEGVHIHGGLSCTALNNVPLPRSKSFPEPQNMTKFGNRVFLVDV